MRKLVCFLSGSSHGPRSASMYESETSQTEITMKKRLCTQLRHFGDWPKKMLPSQEKFIKGKTVGTSRSSKKLYWFRFLGKEKSKNIQCVSAIEIVCLFVGCLTSQQHASVSLVGCLTSQQHASVSQGRICSDNCTCCHTEIEVADQTFRLTQSQYTDTGPTSPSTDPITPGAWQGSHWSTNI